MSLRDGGEWTSLRSGRLTPCERAPDTHRAGCWVGPRCFEPWYEIPYADHLKRSAVPVLTELSQLHRKLVGGHFHMKCLSVHTHRTDVLYSVIVQVRVSSIYEKEQKMAIMTVEGVWLERLSASCVIRDSHWQLIVYWPCFGGNCYLHLQGSPTFTVGKKSWTAMNKEPLSPSETSAINYQPPRRHVYSKLLFYCE
jgi:hypothetical protein